MNQEIPQQMQVVEISKPGGPEVLRPVTQPVPQPKTGEVLIKVQAAGVNRPDVLQRLGRYPVPASASPLPGLEVAGTIAVLGNGVDMWGKWTFKEIDAPGKLVFIDAFSDKDGGLGRHPLAPTWPAQMMTTVLFSDFGPKTLITIQWSPYEADEVERKTFSEGMVSMNQGWSGTFERLDAYLKESR